MKRNTSLSQKRLKQLLEYNPETGFFTWLVYRSQIAKVGYRAGHIKDSGYRYIVVDGISYRSGRLAWLYMNGYFPEYEVDHKDRVRDNDKWTNLRHKTSQCNSRNRGIRSDNKSGVTGVYIHKTKKHGTQWRAQIKISKDEKIYLGVFDTVEEAALNRWDAEKKYNFPNCNTTSSAFLFLKSRGLA